VTRLLKVASAVRLKTSGAAQRSPTPLQFHPREPLRATSSAMLPLAEVLSDMLLRIWPARRHQELLLDLGEHKAWTEGEHRAAVARFAEWLSDELLLPPTLRVEAPVPLDEPRAVALSMLRPAGGARSNGVGAGTSALARIVGSTPKTLANSLAEGLREDRPSHRWLLLLARSAAGTVDADAVVFHRRSPASVAAELSRRAGQPLLDAGDALLVMSLVSLWQRRRKPGEARAARGTELPRRLLPKPVSAVAGELIALPQVRALAELAVHQPAAAGRSIITVALEAALTEAHLAPHRPRRGSVTPEAAGESWLRTTDDVLRREDVSRLLGAEDVGVLAWRIARMRAWRDRSPTPCPTEAATAHPYVVLAQAIDFARLRFSPSVRFASRNEGYLMLIPQARRLGLVEDG
jgi:hypothetical protein